MSLLSFTPADLLKAFVCRGWTDIVCWFSKTKFSQQKNVENCAVHHYIVGGANMGLKYTFSGPFLSHAGQLQ